jgi:nicotinamide riboside kinase
VEEELARRTYDLILLCAADLPWQADPLREHPDLEQREQFFTQYLQLAQASGIPYQHIVGEAEQRLATAVRAIEALVTD